MRPVHRPVAARAQKSLRRQSRSTRGGPVCSSRWLKGTSRTRTERRSAVGELARKDLDDLVTSAERRNGPEPPALLSPVFAKLKRLPDLLPWQKEYVPWLMGSVEYCERYWSQAREIRRWQIGAFTAWLAVI